MGHKTHPFGFRLGIIKDWKTHWYANNGAQYRHGVSQDLTLRRTVQQEYAGFPTRALPGLRLTARRRRRLSTFTRRGLAFSSGGTATG